MAKTVKKTAKKTARKKAAKKVAKKSSERSKRFFLHVSLNEDDDEHVVRVSSERKSKQAFMLCDDGLEIVELTLGMSNTNLKPGAVVELSAKLVNEGYKPNELRDPKVMMQTAEGRDILDAALIDYWDDKTH